MSKKIPVISELPCEEFVRNMFGESWRSLSLHDLNGVWGAVIVRSILDGLSADIREIASHLGVERYMLQEAFTRLSLNGIFLRNRIKNDSKALRANDKHAWGYYSGYASGAIGNVRKEFKKSSSRFVHQNA